MIVDVSIQTVKPWNRTIIGRCYF